MFRHVKYVFVPFGLTLFTPATVQAKNVAEPVKRAPWDVYCEPHKKPTDDSSPVTKPAVAKLEKCLQQCREDLSESDVADYFSQTKSFFQNACSTVTENVKYLQTEASDDLRYATIAGTGLLSGLIFGFRKSFFKKLIYVAFGSGTSSAIIYPKEAIWVAKEGSNYAKDGYKSVYAAIMGTEPEKGKKAKEASQDSQDKKCEKKKKKKEKKEKKFSDSQN